MTTTNETQRLYEWLRFFQQLRDIAADHGFGDIEQVAAAEVAKFEKMIIEWEMMTDE